MITAEGDLKLIDFGLANDMAGRFGDGWQITYTGTKGFMSPEILVGDRYKGDQADFFALTVVLFMMYTKKAPWCEAARSDNFYKVLARNRQDLFWKWHGRSQEESFFSDSFKDFYLKMVAPNPDERLSLPDIVAHPWMQEEVATQAEARQEISRRREIMQE